MDLLVCLAERPGEVWTRDQLFDRVWAGRTVSDGSLSTAISELRRVLGEDRDAVETVRKVGYRLIALPEPVASQRRYSRLLVGVAVAAAAAGAVVWTTVSEAPRTASQHDAYMRSLGLARRGDPNRVAISLLREAVGAEPEWPAAASELAHRLYLDAHESNDPAEMLAESARAARAALAADPDHHAALRQLVILTTERGDLGEAYVLARDAVDRAPDDANARFALAYVYRYAGLLEAAARECELARSAAPANPAFRSCAIPLYRLGRFELAREFLELDHGSQWVLHQEALVRLHEGRRAAAARAFRRLPETSVYNGLLESCGSPETTPATSTVAIDQVAATPEAVTDIEAGYQAALVLVACDRRRAALASLENAVEAGYCAASIADEAPFAALRELPDWPRVVAEAVRCRRQFVRSVSGSPRR